jgi:hypothetical protein
MAEDWHYFSASLQDNVHINLENIPASSEQGCSE